MYFFLIFFREHARLGTPGAEGVIVVFDEYTICFKHRLFVLLETDTLQGPLNMAVQVSTMSSFLVLLLVVNAHA